MLTSPPIFILPLNTVCSFCLLFGGAGRTEGWGMVAYKSTDEVLADVQLVWTNCRRYNAAGSPIK